MEKHARTRATDILPSVRKVVMERDGGMCRICGRTSFLEVCHYIRRSQGGKGCKENLIILCARCHDTFDESPNTEKRQDYGARIKRYLDRHYPDTTDADRIYRKGEQGHIESRKQGG